MYGVGGVAAVQLIVILILNGAPVIFEDVITGVAGAAGSWIF